MGGHDVIRAVCKQMREEIRTPQQFRAKRKPGDTRHYWTVVANYYGIAPDTAFKFYRDLLEQEEANANQNT